MRQDSLPHRSRSRRLAAVLAALALVAFTGFFVPWEKIIAHGNPAPAAYHFVSLRNSSDAEISRFMSGAEAIYSFRQAGAPESNFPKKLWKMDPQEAALAFAEANRSPRHREDFHLGANSNPSLKAPNCGWLILDDFQSKTVLRFGVDQPFLLHAATSGLGMHSTNPFVDSDRHSLQLVPLSPDEARFLAHTAFWLEHLQLTRITTLHRSSSMRSSHESFCIVEWQTDKQRHRLAGSLWYIGKIADRWSGEYDEEVQVNLMAYLFSEALPKHLGERWKTPARTSYQSRYLPLAERLKSRHDPATQAQLAHVVLSGLTRHDADPWPATAVIALVSCAGEAGLVTTLPALEALAARLPPPTADETEFTALDARFWRIYSAPEDPVELAPWERHQALKNQLEQDFPTQVRSALIRAIRQLRAFGQPGILRELAQSNQDAMWALQQLYRVQADAYAEVLVDYFRKGQLRSTAFEVLSALNPVAARRLRDSLTEEEQWGC